MGHGKEVAELIQGKVAKGIEKLKRRDLMPRRAGVIVYDPPVQSKIPHEVL